MDKRTNRDQIQNALNITLSDLQDDPWLAQRVITEAKGAKKVKKELSMALVVTLVLIFAVATALAVSTFAGLFHLKQSDVGAMRGCVSTGDALYLMSSSGLCRWTPGDDEPETLVSIDELTAHGISFESLLYLENGTLGLVDVDHKKLWRYQDGGFTLLLDYANTEMDFPALRWSQAVFHNECLFLLGQLDDETSGKLLYRANPRTGEVEPLPIAEGYPAELCAYESGKLLALVTNVQQRSESLLVLEAATGAVSETLYTAPIQNMQGLAYGKSGLYALVGGVLSRWDGAEWTGLNAAAHSFLAQSFAVMDEGYVSVSFDEMQYLPFSSEDRPPSLTIRGMMAIDDADADFQNINGAAVTRYRDPALTAQDVREAIEAGDTTDLFLLRMDADVIRLMDDGLAAPLGSSDILNADTQTMTPLIRDALLVHDIPYAMAYLVTPMVWQGDYAIPSTYTELLVQVNSGRISLAYEGGESWTKMQYANALLEGFISESARDNETIDFHTESFANALLALNELILPSDQESVATKRVNPAKVLSLGGDFPSDLPQRGKRNYELSKEYADEPQWLLPPTVVAKASSSVPARLTIYLLNKNAQNPQAAIAYLEYVATHRDPGDEGLMKPDLAEPVLHPAVQRELDEHREIFGENTETSAPTMVALDNYEAALRAVPDSWAITGERLDIYRNTILPYLDLKLHPLFSASARGNGGIYDLLLQTVLDYVGGNGTLAECLDRLQNIASVQ